MKGTARASAQDRRVAGACAPAHYPDRLQIVSGQIVEPLRAYAEYDGFGLNEGFLLTWKAGKAKKK